MSNDKEKADKALKDLMETPYTDYDGYDAAEEFITDLNKKALKYEAGAPFDGYGNFTDHLAVQSPSGTRGGIVEITTEDLLWSKIERVLGVGLNRTAQTLKYEVRSYLMFLQSSLADMYNEAFENFPEMYVACMQYANLHLKSCSSGSSLSSENGDNWNETIMFLRYLKHISLNIEGMDNDSLKPVVFCLLHLKTRTCYLERFSITLKVATTPGSSQWHFFLNVLPPICEILCRSNAAEAARFFQKAGVETLKCTF